MHAQEWLVVMFPVQDTVYVIVTGSRPTHPSITAQYRMHVCAIHIPHWGVLGQPATHMHVTLLSWRRSSSCAESVVPPSEIPGLH